MAMIGIKIVGESEAYYVTSLHLGMGWRLSSESKAPDSGTIFMIKVYHVVVRMSDANCFSVIEMKESVKEFGIVAPTVRSIRSAEVSSVTMNISVAFLSLVGEVGFVLILDPIAVTEIMPGIQGISNSKTCITTVTHHGPVPYMSLGSW